MLVQTIEKYIQNPKWLSQEPIRISNQESILFPWLFDDRLNFFVDNQSYRLTPLLKIKSQTVWGDYYLQGVDINNDQVIDAMVITDSSGNIIEDFIFQLINQNLNGEKIVIKIKNREQRIINDVLRDIGLNINFDNTNLLLELLSKFEFNIFYKPLTRSEIFFLKFLIGFDINYIKTKGSIDLKKINFIFERLDNPWSQSEIITIFQLLNDYENISTIKEAEIIFGKIGGLRNISLLLYRGKYHLELIEVAKKYNLKQKELIQAISEVKKIIKRFELI